MTGHRSTDRMEKRRLTSGREQTSSAISSLYSQHKFTADCCDKSPSEGSALSERQNRIVFLVLCEGRIHEHH